MLGHITSTRWGAHNRSRNSPRRLGGRCRSCRGRPASARSAEPAADHAGLFNLSPSDSSLPER
eukprot:8761220-Pyramimonas_sp.AAC.1